jgi:hypothetical protein
MRLQFDVQFPIFLFWWLLFKRPYQVTLSQKEKKAQKAALSSPRMVHPPPTKDVKDE